MAGRCVILGGGGHARVVLEALRASKAAVAIGIDPTLKARWKPQDLGGDGSSRLFRKGLCSSSAWAPSATTSRAASSSRGAGLRPQAAERGPSLPRSSPLGVRVRLRHPAARRGQRGRARRRERDYQYRRDRGARLRRARARPCRHRRDPLRPGPRGRAGPHRRRSGGAPGRDGGCGGRRGRRGRRRQGCCGRLPRRRSARPPRGIMIMGCLPTPSSSSCPTSTAPTPTPIPSAWPPSRASRGTRVGIINTSS